MDNQRGSISVILAGLFAVFFIISTIFGVWAFSGMQNYKNNTDLKVKDAVVLAVQKAVTAKDVEFASKEKLPTRIYRGASTYGSLTFSYPKTWSVYSVKPSNGMPLDLYFSPLVVPDISSGQSYALRVQITSTFYSKEAASIADLVTKGTMKAQAFRPKNVKNVLGLKAEGTIKKGKQGGLVLLPLRDRSIKLFTESQEFVNDFNNIVVPSITFAP